MKVEYQIREITRYIVTRFEDNSGLCGTSERGTYDNEDIAYEVAYALARKEHEDLGYPLADERIKYPIRPSHERAQAQTLGVIAAGDPRLGEVSAACAGVAVAHPTL